MRPSPLARVVLLLVRLYRAAPKRAGTCRFHPSCSAYALDAVSIHGAVRGSWFTLRRLGRCHPFHPGGIDPVPPARRPVLN